MGSKNKKTNKGGGGGAGDGDGKRKVIEDPRFSKVQSDPRFARAPKHKAKVAIDSRFAAVFTDKRFATSSSHVDKRGKAKQQSEHALRRFYHFDEEKQNENAKRKQKILSDDDEVESDEGVKPAELASSESSEELSELELEPESDDSTSTTDTDDEDEEMLNDNTSLEVENVPVIEKETNRLAVVNMDWSHVKAVDLFVVLSSFLPKGGDAYIKSVTVYPSDFGMQRMEEEAFRGPVALFEDEKKKKKKSEDDSNNEEDGDDDEEDGDDDDDVDDEDDDEDEDEDEDDDDDDEIDPEKLRAYEKSRLRYYYAVVECDSVSTADYLYKNCDGSEFERSSNVLDLRFIPDSMEFKHPPRDVATEVPADYEGLDFHTRALQQSNTVLSWDDDEPHRVKTMRRKFSENQLAEMELNEFLASDESESDEDENGDKVLSEKQRKKADKYRSLLLSGGGDSDGEEEEDDEGQNMEVTFNTGLEDISKKILEKKDKGSETVWESYLRKKKEKKKARKFRSKNSSSDNDSDDEAPLEQADDFFEEEPSVGKSKNVAKGKKKREEKKLIEDRNADTSRAELELLLADEDGADKKLKGYKIKLKKAKGKKGKEGPDEAKLPPVNLEDPRFTALFSNPGFALDPTDPQFQRSATYLRQLAQRQQKDRKEDADVAPMELSVVKEDDNAVGTARKEKHELSSIVKSLKLKSQQRPMQSSLKTKKEKTESHGSTAEKKKRKLPSSDGSMKKDKA